MKRRLYCGMALALLLSLPILVQGADPKSSIRVEHDLVFGKGGDEELKLDLAMPASGDGPFPAMICLHGGGWKSGQRQDLDNSIEGLARHGYVAITVSYRLAPAAKFPAQIEDCKAAVRWLRANAAKYHVNSERIGAIGFSAGAHLACLLGTTDKNDGLEGAGGNPEQSSRVQVVVSFFGPTDFTSKTWNDALEKDTLEPVLGASFADKPDLYRKFSPVTYVSKDDAPTLFFHGTEDKVVAIRHSKVVAEKLQAVGVEARVVEVPGEGHGWRGEKLGKSIAEAIAFLDDHLKK